MTSTVQSDAQDVRDVRPAPTSPAPARRPNPALRAKLFESLPAAKRVLSMGERSDWLAESYSLRHPGVVWLRAGSDVDAFCMAAASAELVVFPDGMESIEEPIQWLKRLALHCRRDVPLFIGVGRDEAGSTHFSPQALCMLLMDAGWMPNLDGSIVQGTLTFEALPVQAPASTPSRFAAVVPTNRPEEFELNVGRSPGLLELEVPVYSVSNASSPADALEQALPHVAQDWILLCHQDVYFPEGFGHRLNDVLAAIPAEQRASTLLGFIGKGVDKEKSGFVSAGFVIDRMHKLDFPESSSAVSVDELAIVIARESIHRIDPAMGWHLWATDLCLASICKHQVLPSIVRLPLFHNSVNDGRLPASFHDSASLLLAKYPEFGPIPTMCGTIQAPIVSASPVAVPAVTTAPAAAPIACCICHQAVEAWLPHPHIGARSEVMKLLNAVGSDLSVYQCPSCHSTDRDRHLWHYMSAVGLIDRIPAMRILHIAPERHIEKLIESLNPAAYVRGDLHPQRASHVKLDVESLAFDDGSFDLVICNHVLEHVSSPDRALAEFHRCLSAGGLLIAQTPYSASLKHTLELNRPVSPAFARLFYGQDDHVRLFGADIVDAFHAAGFSGELLPHRVVLPGMDAKAQGCNAQEPFFCFNK